MDFVEIGEWFMQQCVYFELLSVIQGCYQDLLDHLAFKTWNYHRDRILKAIARFVQLLRIGSTLDSNEVYGE